jgi:hypothetical protein
MHCRNRFEHAFAERTGQLAANELIFGKLCGHRGSESLEFCLKSALWRTLWDYHDAEYVAITGLAKIGVSLA